MKNQLVNKVKTGLNTNLFSSKELVPKIPKKSNSSTISYLNEIEAEELSPKFIVLFTEWLGTSLRYAAMVAAYNSTVLYKATFIP